MKKASRWQVKVTFDSVIDKDILAEIWPKVNQGAAAATTIKAQLRERLALLEFKTLTKDLLGTSGGPTRDPQVLLPQSVRSQPEDEDGAPFDLMAGFMPD